jgi:hypothetical protein
MVAGHLQEKNGIYYVVLTYKTYDGKRKTKWQSTGLPIKGNKRRAEAMMRELQDDFEPPVDPTVRPAKLCCLRIIWCNGWKSQSQPSS